MKFYMGMGSKNLCWPFASEAKLILLPEWTKISIVEWQFNSEKAIPITFYNANLECT
jgi:hypothetical protein